MSRAFLSGATIQGTDVAGVLGVNSMATGAIGVVVKGFTGQTASLQEWRNVGGTALAKVDAAGAMLPSHLAIAAVVAPTTALIVAGSTGIPSGLNSSSPVTGIVTVPTNAGTGQIQGVSVQPTSTGSSLNLIGYLGTVRFAHASLVATSGRVFEAGSPVITAGGTITTATGVSILAQKITGVTTGYGINQIGVDDLNNFAGRTTVVSGNAAYVPLVVKAAASQVGDLQQWQSSASVVNALIDANGNITEKRTTFTPTAAGWYRIAIGTNQVSGTVAIKGTMDVYMTDIEFEYSISGYTLPGYINLTRYLNYNGGVITQIRTSSDGAAACYLDIYIPHSGITYAPVTVHARGMHQTALVAAPVVGAVAGASSVNVLTVGPGFRSTTGANFAEVSGNVGIGLASPGAKLTVVNTVAATTATSIKGAASQSAPLTQWLSSANAVLAMVRFDGLIGAPYLRDPTDTGPFFAMQTDTIVCVPPAANLVPFTVRGAASQTANLQVWQTSAGTVLAAITTDGALKFVVAGDETSANMIIARPPYKNTSLVIVGAGTVSGSRNVHVYDTLSVETSLAVPTASFTTTIGFPSSVGDKVFLYGAGATAFGFGIQSSRLVSFIPSGSGFAIRPSSGTGAASSGADAIVLMPDGSMTQTINTAASVGHLIKGAASQSGALSEWRSSANALLASVRPDGEVRTVSIRDVAGTSAQLLMSPGASPDGIIAYAGTAAAVVFQVRGQTVQTGDLQQWHNNFIVLGRVTADGKFGLGSAAPTARLNVAGFTDILQMLVKGHSTQTASLQEWQNSGGTVLAKIDSGGRLTATNWVVSSTAPSSPATNDVWIDTSS